MDKKEFEDLLRAWAEEEVRSAPEEHSQKTPSCLSFGRFDGYVGGTIELSVEEEQHIQTCPYCQKVEAMFRKEVEEELEEKKLKEEESTLLLDEGTKNIIERCKDFLEKSKNGAKSIAKRITDSYLMEKRPKDSREKPRKKTRKLQ